MNKHDNIIRYMIFWHFNPNAVTVNIIAHYYTEGIIGFGNKSYYFIHLIIWFNRKYCKALLYVIVCVTAGAIALSFYQLLFLHANPEGANGAIFVEWELMWVRLCFPLTTSEHCCSAAVLINGPESVTLTWDRRCSSLSEAERNSPAYCLFWRGRGVKFYH